MSKPLFLVGTEHGLHALGVKHELHLAGHQLTALAIDGRSWWVILDGRSAWRSRAGRGWKEVATVEGCRANCLLPRPSGPWIGTSEARLLRLRDSKLRPIASFERVAGRRSWFTPWGGPPDTRSLAAGRDGTVFVNVHVGGIPRSRDDGRTWQPTLEVLADTHQVLVHPAEPDTVVAATARGLAVSRDGGDSWDFVTKGLHALYARAVAFAGEHVLVSISRSERGERSALYRWRLDDGAPLERCRDGLPTWFSNNVNTGCIAANAKTALLGAPDGSVYTSEDQGASWRLLRDGLPPVRCVALG